MTLDGARKRFARLPACATRRGRALSRHLFYAAPPRHSRRSFGAASREFARRSAAIHLRFRRLRFAGRHPLRSLDFDETLPNVDATVDLRRFAQASSSRRLG
jgi:hypothetical protein